MKKALTDYKYELIKSHILDPDNTPLSVEQADLLNRVISASKILDKNPIVKHAVAIHLVKFPNIQLRQAYEDMRLAVKLFNTLHTFDYDMWLTWLINDIVNNIETARKRDTHQDRKVIALEHANLIKALGKRPEELPDPTRNEKHQFYILVNVNNQQIKLDLNQLNKLPEETLRELNRALTGQEITEAEAVEIMNT